MKNYKILTLLVLFLVGLGVASAADSLNVTPESFSFQGNVSQTFSGSFQVKNTGDTTTNVSFYKTALVSGSNSFAIGGTQNAMNNFAPNATISRSFTITIPSNQAPGTYNGQICANATVSGVHDCTAISVIVNEKIALTVTNLSMSGYQNSTLSGTFTLTNNGNTELNNLLISSISNMDLYNLAYSENYITLTAGQSKSITVTGTIPAGQTGVKRGTFTVSNDYVTVEAGAALTIRSKLAITEVYMECAAKDDTISTNGASFDFDEECFPGSEMVLKIKVENEADEDITDIEIDATFENIDDGDDVEAETVDAGDLNDGKEKQFTVSFDDIENRIPWITDEDDYVLTIEIAGEGDDSNYDYGETWEVIVPVNRNDDPYMRIMSASLVPDIAQCGDSVSINAEAINLGDDDSDFVLEFKSTTLGFDRKYNFELSSNYDDDFCTFAEADDDCVGVDDTYAFTVPSNAKGNYTIDVIAWSASKQTDKQTITLEVTCGKTTTTTTTTNTTTTTQTNDDDEVVVINTNPTNQYTTLPVRIVETSRPLLDKNSKEYPYIIAGGIIVVLAILIGMIVMLTKK